MLIDNPPVEIADGIWMLGTTAYPVYLVCGPDDGMIIEGGIGALGPLLKRQLAELGIASDYVREVVVMHAHPDHVMAIPMLRELFPRITVAASAQAAATLSVEKAVAFFARMDADLTAGLHRTGAIAETPPPVVVPDNRIAVDFTVGEGYIISLGGCAFTVLETPGHSDCSISLHEPQRRLLVISDASGFYMPALGTWWPGYFTGYEKYIHSMERLAALDAETLCLSHYGAIRGRDEVRDYLTGAIAATRQYHERIIAETKAGRSAREIAEQLGEEIHRVTPILPLDFFQKNCGIMVKQSLKHEGLAY